MKQILISGYYGFGNAGDEAVLAGLIAGLRSHAAATQLAITALSIAPAATEALHGIHARNRYRQLLPALMKTDLLVSGGGSLLQDVTSAHGIFYYLAVVRMAQILGCKTMFAAQGIGPITRPHSTRLTASVANRVDAITVRDVASCTFLQTIGVTIPINITADPALLLQPELSAKREGIGLSIRKSSKAQIGFESDLATAIMRENLPRRVQVLNMHGDADADAVAETLRCLRQPAPPRDKSKPAPNFRALLATVSGCELVIGMRLHSLIFAAAAGVPMVALSYDPKIDAFMHQIGLDEAVIDLAHTDVLRIATILGNIWLTRREREENIKKRLPGLRQLAQKNTDIAFHLLR